MRTLLVIAILLLKTISTYACNSCGCSAANQSIGLFSQISSNFVGFQYQMRGFNTTHPDDGEMDMPGISHEYYETYQLTGKYSVGKRINIYAFIPYIVNTRKQNDVSPILFNGVGDVTLLSNFNLFKKSNCTWKQDFIVGGGLKLPTGVYDRQSTKTEDGLPNMQPGTHSWDIIVNSSYTMSRELLGLNIDANYTITTANNDNYKYGNRFSTNSFAFYKIKRHQLTILPQLGVSYDNVQKDYTNHSEKQIDDDSGSWQLYTLAGIQALYKNLGVSVRYLQPLSQHYNSGLVTNRYKTEAGILFLF